MTVFALSNRVFLKNLDTTWSISMEQTVTSAA